MYNILSTVASLLDAGVRETEKEHSKFGVFLFFWLSSLHLLILCAIFTSCSGFSGKTCRVSTSSGLRHYSPSCTVVSLKELLFPRLHSFFSGSILHPMTSWWRGYQGWATLPPFGIHVRTIPAPDLPVRLVMASGAIAWQFNYSLCPTSFLHSLTDVLPNNHLHINIYMSQFPRLQQTMTF